MVVFLGVMILMSLNSCQKDEDLIVGKWECTKIEKECERHTYVITHDDGTVYEDECEIMSSLLFRTGDIWYFDADGTMIFWGFTNFWNINEDVLNINKEAFTIEKLTSSEMILVGKEECYDYKKDHWYRLYLKKI